jgi:hypothetical protein
MPTAAYDGAVYDHSNQYEDDKRLLVMFFREAVKNEVKSAEAGRPIFDEVDMIRVITPGSRDVLVTKANQHYKDRFPKHWDLYQRKQEQIGDGTPLDQVPFLTVGQIAELKALNVMTLEQLAGLADNVAHRFMGFNDMKRKAQQYLEAAKSAAPITKLNEELAKRDAEIEALKQQMAQLIAAQKPAPQQVQQNQRR